MTPSFLGSSAVLRAAALYLVWIVLAAGGAGVGAGELVAGVPVALLAGWVSLQLLPPSAAPRTRSPNGRYSRAALRALAVLILRFPFQSLAAGFEVARRALSWPLRVQPGIVACRCALPRAGAGAGGAGGPEPVPADVLPRGVFRVLLALQPGSLPVGEREDGALLMHSLDVTAPIAEQVALEEALFAAAIGRPVTGQTGNGDAGNGRGVAERAS